MPTTLLEAAPYLAGLAGLGVALFLFIEMKRMQQDFQTRWAKRQQLLQSELGKTRSQVQQLILRVDEAERRAELAGVPPSNMKSINLNRRTQAMRLFRRGESAAQVAASLGVPQCQTELLLKIHRILNASVNGRAVQN